MHLLGRTTRKHANFTTISLLFIVIFGGAAFSLEMVPCFEDHDISITCVGRVKGTFSSSALSSDIPTHFPLVHIMSPDLEEEYAAYWFRPTREANKSDIYGPESWPISKNAEYRIKMEGGGYQFISPVGILPSWIRWSTVSHPNCQQAIALQREALVDVGMRTVLKVVGLDGRPVVGASVDIYIQDLFPAPDPEFLGVANSNRNGEFVFYLPNDNKRRFAMVDINGVKYKSPELTTAHVTFNLSNTDSIFTIVDRFERRASSWIYVKDLDLKHIIAKPILSGGKVEIPHRPAMNSGFYFSYGEKLYGAFGPGTHETIYVGSPSLQLTTIRKHDKTTYTFKWYSVLASNLSGYTFVLLQDDVPIFSTNTTTQQVSIRNLKKGEVYTVCVFPYDNTGAYFDKSETDSIKILETATEDTSTPAISLDDPAFHNLSQELMNALQKDWLSDITVNYNIMPYPKKQYEF